MVTLPRFDLEQFLRAHQDYRITRSFVAPPIVLALARHPLVDSFDLSQLRLVNSGAAPLKAELTAECSKRLDCEVVQGYGMTELSPVSRLTPPGWFKPGSVGVTAPGTQTRIVDPVTGADLGTGEEGEVWVRGSQVMSGYLNNPQATAATVDADRWLHTGDLGYMDADGHLYVVDRLKELIKYKGFQVPPAELEAVLLRHPDVADAAVIGLPDYEAGEIPPGYVVLRPGAAACPEEIMRYVAGEVAHYKQIRRLEVIDEIPKSAAGKILRRVLRDSAGTRSAIALSSWPGPHPCSIASAPPPGQDLAWEGTADRSREAAMHTPVCDRLAIEFPIFAFSHCRDVVAAVTNAGGFGVLGATGHSPRTLDVDLTWIDEQTRGKPYGVDLLLPAKYEKTSRAREPRFPAGHRAFVDDLLTRYGIPELPGHIPAASGSISVSAQDADDLLDVAFGHPIRLVASALGPPPAELVTRAHDRGVVVAALVGTAEHARRQQAAGVDLIVAQGTEAGGHTGTISTMVLVPEVIRRVHPTPVLAAGGIVTGAQVAAALALGAQGVWCGSVWLTTEEAETDPSVQKKMLAATCADTVRSRSLTGKPARMLRSAWTDEWEGEKAPAALPMPLQTMLTAQAQQRINRHAATEGSGAQQLATYFVGQGVGLMDRVRPARQVVEQMVADYLAVAERFAAQLEG